MWYPMRGTDGKRNMIKTLRLKNMCVPTRPERVRAHVKTAALYNSTNQAHQHTKTRRSSPPVTNRYERAPHCSLANASRIVRVYLDGDGGVARRFREAVLVPPRRRHDRVDPDGHVGGHSHEGPRNIEGRAASRRGGGAEDADLDRVCMMMLLLEQETRMRNNLW